MEKAQRLYLDGYDGDMREDPDGEYVTYAAHAAIVAEIVGLLRSYRREAWHQLCMDNSKNIYGGDVRCSICKRTDTALEPYK